MDPSKRPGDVDRLFTLSPALLCIADTSGYFQYVNPAFETTLGYSQAELLARPFVELVHPDDREATVREIQRLATGHPTIHFENRYRCRDGGWRWLLWTAAPQIEDGLIFAAAHDVTDIRQTENRFLQLLECTPDAIVVTDGDGAILLVNAMTERIFGYPRRQLLGREVEVLVPERLRDAHRGHRRRYAAQPHARPMSRGLELTCLRSDGSEFPAEISLGYLKTDDKLQVFAAIRDITERKRSEAFLREKEAQLLIAQEIQRRLLPSRPPSLPGLDIAGANYACDYAAGDFFDYVQLPDGQLGIFVGDVSGHGIGPALLAGCAHTLMRLLARNTRDPADMLTAANAYLLDQTDDHRFVTMFMGSVDPSTKTLTYCSAGHHPAYILDAQGLVKQELWGVGLPPTCC